MSSHNITCGTCAKKFHACGTCDLTQNWEFEFCSLDCMKNSDKYQKFVKISRSLVKTMSGSQRGMLMDLIDNGDNEISLPILYQLLRDGVIDD